MSKFKLLSPFFATSLLISLTFSFFMINRAQADGPETAPKELRETIAKIDAAANNHRLEQVLDFYAPEFTNADGLDRKQIGQGLDNLWKQYPDLHYSTRLLSWNQDQNNLITETQTTIEGASHQKIRSFLLISTIKSRQFLQNNHLVKQEILAESTQLKSGEKPPEIDVNLPNSVKVGQNYDFDVILKEPLSNQVSVGYALADKVNGVNFFKSANFDLEVLQSGGIFKRGKAPETPEDQWLSAIIVQSNGMTIVTQRLKIDK